MKKLLLIVLALHLTGCDEIALYNKPDVVYRVERIKGKAKGNIERSTTVLAARLKEYQQSSLSEIAISEKDGERLMTFRHGAPDERLISQMSATVGYFEGGVLDGSPASITSKDVLDAQATVDGEGNPTLAIRLTPQAGQRLQEITRKNSGEMLAFFIDSEQIVLARIGEPLGASFRLSSESLEKARLHALLLRNGPLDMPLRVSAVK